MPRSSRAALNLPPGAVDAPNGSRRARSSVTVPTGRSIGARCGAITRKWSTRSASRGRSPIRGGPRRPRYPYRSHPLNAAADYLARAAARTCRDRSTTHDTAWPDLTPPGVACAPGDDAARASGTVDRPNARRARQSYPTSAPITAAGRRIHVRRRAYRQRLRTDRRPLEKAKHHSGVSHRWRQRFSDRSSMGPAT